MLQYQKSNKLNLNAVPLCGTCQYGDLLLKRNRGEDRKTNPLRATGKADCSKPEYKGKTWSVKDNRTDCPSYKKREYGRGEAVQNEQ